MKKKILFWSATGALFILLIMLSKASRDLEYEVQQESTVSEHSRELENERGISTIVSIEDTYYYDLLENEKGNICALTDNTINGDLKNEPVIVWESSNGGEKWEELLYQPEEIGKHSDILAGALKCGKEGTEVFVVFSEYKDGEQSSRLYRITESYYKELNATEVFNRIGNMVWNISFVNDHVISIASGEQCALYDIKKQEVLKCLAYDAYTVGFLTMPEQFLVYGKEVLYCLDVETLEEKQPEENLKTFITSVYDKNESGGGNVFPPMDMHGNVIVCATAGAIYEYRDERMVQVLSIPSVVNGRNCLNGMMPVCKGKDNSYYVSAFTAGKTELHRIEVDREVKKEKFTIYCMALF